MEMEVSSRRRSAGPDRRTNPGGRVTVYLVMHVTRPADRSSQVAGGNSRRDPLFAPGFLKGPAGPLSRAPRLVCRLPGNSPLKNIFFQKSQGRKLLFLPVSAILPKPCPCFCAFSPKVCGGGAGIWRMGRAAWYYCYQKYFPAVPVHTLFCAPPCLIPAGIPARRSFGGSHSEKKASAKPQRGSRRPAVRMFALLFSVGSLRQWYGRFFREM